MGDDRKTITLFGQAPYFLVMNDGHVVDAVANPHAGSMPAALPAVDFISGFQPDRVVASSFGAVALDALRERNIEAVTEGGMVNLDFAAKPTLEQRHQDVLGPLRESLQDTNRVLQVVLAVVSVLSAIASLAIYLDNKFRKKE